MNTQIQNILSQTTSKTHKIQQLLILGLTRRQVAELVTNGNYGFVQNVYAKMQLESIVNNPSCILGSRIFNRRFGVEFEAYNVEMNTLNNKLNSAGVLCEVEGYNHTTRDHWKIVTDGSLTGTNTFELVSPVLQGEPGIETLKTVCRVLNECGAKVNKSCGTHVHFDASDFNIQIWKNIYINYYRLENVIDGFMPLSRRNNTYCKELRGLSRYEQKINGCSNINQIQNFFGSRYFKINPMSYSRHKTCEFRQHSGTVEFEKISNWIYFLNNFVELSKNRLIQNPSINTLIEFNDESLTTYLKNRTQRLAI